MTRFPVMQLWCDTDSCLVIYFFRVDRLSCKSNIVLWFTHTQSASSAICALSEHQEEDLRGGRLTLFSISSLAHLFPHVPIHNVWFGLVCGFWIGLLIELFTEWISLRRHWTLLRLVPCPLPSPDVCKAPLPPSLPLLSISIRVFKCIKWADAPFKYNWLHHLCTCSLPWIQVNFLPLLSLHLAIPH